MSVNRRTFLTQTLGATAGLALAAPRRAPKLNFVFILIDDMGWRDLGCFGSTYYETPHIDRLASQGMRFTNAYAACPVCSPTRASIISGKYPARLKLTDWIPGRKQWPTARVITPQFNQQLPLAEVTIAEALKPAGYATASIGKWHLGGDGFSPREQGFDLNVGGTFRGSPKSYFGPFDLPGLQDSTKDEYLTDRLSTEAEKFIEANKDRPFFLYLPEFAVHIPLGAKQKLIAKYEAKPRSGEQNNAIYAAMIESLDLGIERVLNKLESLKIADRTVVIFMADNGGLRYEGRSKAPVTSNAPLRAGKGHLFEGGIREPMMVRWPGIVKPGTVCDVPVSSVDFYPTILEAAGVRPGPGQILDGKSIVPLLTQTGKWSRDAIYWHYPHYSNQGGVPGGAVRVGDFKLIEFYEDGHLELYNLKDDIGEHKNLAKEAPQKAAELHGMLQKWRQSVDAQMPKPNPNYDPATANQGLTGTEPPGEED